MFIRVSVFFADFPRAFSIWVIIIYFEFHPYLLTVLYKVKFSEKVGRDAMGNFSEACRA